MKELDPNRTHSLTNYPLPQNASSQRSRVLNRLKTGPCTAIDLTALSESDRQRIKILRADTPTRRLQSRNATEYIPVYYLPEDEPAAISLFYDLNVHRIQNLDLNTNNPLKQSLPAELYVRVLEAAGRVDVRRYNWIVRERRETGDWWFIEPQYYDTHPEHRYTPGEYVARVPPAVALQDLYYQAGPTISKTDIRATAIEGNPMCVLWFYVVCDRYPGKPRQTEAGEPVVETDPAT